MLAQLKNRLRKRRAHKKLLNEINPEAVQRLAYEVDSLSLCAAITCPDELSLQCIQKDYHSLRARAASPTLANEPPQIRLQLRQGLIHSRQQFIRSLQNTAQPTRFLQ